MNKLYDCRPPDGGVASQVKVTLHSFGAIVTTTLFNKQRSIDLQIN